MVGEIGQQERDAEEQHHHADLGEGVATREPCPESVGSRGRRGSRSNRRCRYRCWGRQSSTGAAFAHRQRHCPHWHCSCCDGNDRRRRRCARRTRFRGDGIVKCQRRCRRQRYGIAGRRCGRDVCNRWHHADRKRCRHRGSAVGSNTRLERGEALLETGDSILHGGIDRRTLGRQQPAKDNAQYYAERSAYEQAVETLQRDANQCAREKTDPRHHQSP